MFIQIHIHTDRGKKFIIIDSIVNNLGVGARPFTADLLIVTEAELQPEATWATVTWATVTWGT